MRGRRARFWRALALLLPAATAAAPASAQTPKAPAAKPTPAPPAPPAPAPVGADPGSTQATYGDWVLQCQRVGEGEHAQRLCEVAQTITVQGRQGPFAQIAFSRIDASDPLRMTVALPTNIAIPSSVTVAPGSDAAAPTFELGWRRCLPGGCIADGLPPADAMKLLRGATAPGRMIFKNAAGQDVAVPLSLRGLAQALDALAKA